MEALTRFLKNWLLLVILLATWSLAIGAIAAGLLMTLQIPDQIATYQHATNSTPNQSPPDAATQTIADYTELLAWFTAILAIASIAQGWFIKQQIRLARDEFSATHRPRIILREAYTAPDNGNPVTVTYTLENTGSSETHIVNSRFTIFFSVAGGTKRQVRFDEILEPGEIANVVPIGTKIAPGESYRGTCAAIATWWSPDWIALNPDANGDFTMISSIAGGWHLYFYGMVSYRDSLKITRNMAFYRILEFSSYRFIPFGDPQLEYSDERP
jgi:hypothetical protein